MKQISIILVLMTGLIQLYGQDVSNKTVANRTPSGKFFRPSMTVLFVDRGESLSGQLISEVNKKGLSDKYNDNSVRDNVIPLSAGINETGLKSWLEKNVSGKIIDIWFPFDQAAGQHTLNVVAERGMYNATDADVIRAKASVRGEGMLKDVGYELIGKSFFLIYDMYGAERKVYKDDKGNEYKSYQTSCDIYVYQLDWNDAVIAQFSNMWTNPNASREMTFPVKKYKFIVKDLKLTPVSVSSTTNRSSSTFKEDSQLISDLAAAIVEKSDIMLTQANTDFQAQGSIFKMDPIRSKVGMKEGVKVNQRWFVYELEQKSDGKIAQNRKGVIRATGKIADNRTQATGDSKTSQFYQIYGGRLAEGMLLQQKPDFGFALTGTLGTDINAMVEAYAPIERVRVYARVAYSFLTSEAYFGIGVSREMHFLRYFSMAPFIGVSPDPKNLDSIEGYGLDAGLNGCIYVLHNFQLFSQLSLNTKCSNYVNLGVGARITY